MTDFDNLEKTIGYTFADKKLLRQALVHRSYLNEHPDFELGHNERLEFLGDAVLEIIVTEYLYHQYPDKTEGELTDWRASLVNSRALAEVANEIDLEKDILLSRGEAKDTGSKARQFILANAVEAVIGAIYLDGGIKPSQEFIHRFMISKLEHILENQLYRDPKSKFQEKAQELFSITPHYRVLSESGPDHNKTFEVGAYIDSDLIATGKGTSKHEAQENAARNSLDKKGW